MNPWGRRTGGIDDDSKMIDDDSQMNHLSLQKNIDSWLWIVCETGDCAFRCTPNHFCVNAIMTPSATARSAPDFLGNDNQSNFPFRHGTSRTPQGGYSSAYCYKVLHTFC
jgi:hypothetical protein